MVDPLAPVTPTPQTTAAAPTDPSGKPTTAQIQAFGLALYNATAANQPLADASGADDDDDDPDDDGSNTLKMPKLAMPVLTPSDASASTDATTTPATVAETT